MSCTSASSRNRTLDIEVVEGEDPSTDLPKQSPPQTRLQYPMKFDLEVVEGEDPSTDLPTQSPPQTRLQYPMITQTIAVVMSVYLRGLPSPCGNCVLLEL